MSRTIEEINERIQAGTVVVVTAEEVIDIVKEKGVKRATAEVDVVTTGTFGPMCSSGAYFNIGHVRPRMKLGGGTAYLNDVPAYCGFAAVDLLIGCNALPDYDPRNRNHPGDFNYGGGHVIEDLVSGKDIRLVAEAYGTDCYPRQHLSSWLNIKDLNEAVLFNPRNAYQNYNIATNTTDKTIYTYMGILKPHMGNITYCSAGQLSPLLKDPYFKTIGIGSRIFLGGGIGYVAWNGTQFDPNPLRGPHGIPKRGAGTLAVIGDLKQMSPRYLVGTSMQGYGCTLTVGIGVPIPILSEDIMETAAVPDSEIFGGLIDYGGDYPLRQGDALADISYGELRTGKVTIEGREIPTSSLSSYPRAAEIATTLKEWIRGGKFLLTRPVTSLPQEGSNYNVFHPFVERPIDE